MGESLALHNSYSARKCRSCQTLVAPTYTGVAGRCDRILRGQCSDKAAVLISNLDTENRSFCTPKSPDQLWDLPDPLCNVDNFFSWGQDGPGLQLAGHAVWQCTSQHIYRRLRTKQAT